MTSHQQKRTGPPPAPAELSPRTVDKLADVRTGDKGDDLILAVLPRSAEAFEHLRDTLSEAAVAQHYQHDPAHIRRTVLTPTQSLVFHLQGLLNGGVTGSSYLDGHGKTLGYHLLSLET